jgi:hypothetical protein
VIGHPVGPNSEAVFVRLDRRISDDWAAAAELLDRKARKAAGPNPDDTRRMGLLLVRDLSPCLSLTARLESLRLPAKESRAELAASWAF